MQIATVKIKVLGGVARLLEIYLQIAIRLQVSPIGTPWLKFVSEYPHRFAGRAMGTSWPVDIFAGASETTFDQLVVNSARMGMMRISINIDGLAIVEVTAFVYRPLIKLDSLLRHRVNLFNTLVQPKK